MKPIADVKSRPARSSRGDAPARGSRRSYSSPLRDEQAEETRIRILEALVRTMARGVADLTIPAVAEEAGVSVPTIYRHFGAKREPNLPQPSGMSPNMLTVVLNDPGPILDRRPGSPTLGQFIEDPFFNRKYSQFSYTFQYMPGTTTYLDTPVVPVAAFAGPDQNPLDCELVAATPRVFAVNGSLGGPHVSVANGTQTLTIVAPAAAQNGLVEVPNPAYDGTNARTILRDHGFGVTPGVVRLGTDVLPINSLDPGHALPRQCKLVQLPGVDDHRLVADLGHGRPGQLEGNTHRPGS